MNTNKVYNSFIQRGADRRGENGIEGYQRVLISEMNFIQEKLKTLKEGTPEFKHNIYVGRTVLNEMKRAGIEISYD